MNSTRTDDAMDSESKALLPSSNQTSYHSHSSEAFINKLIETYSARQPIREKSLEEL